MAKDLLFGRGGAIQAHQGNVAFRSLVDERASEFKSTRNDSEKREIAVQILQILRQRKVRFLVEDTTSSCQEEKPTSSQGLGWLLMRIWY